MFLLDLRTEMRLRFGCQGLDRKNREPAQVQRTTTASTAKGTMVEAQASSQKFITASRDPSNQAAALSTLTSFHSKLPCATANEVRTISLSLLASPDLA